MKPWTIHDVTSACEVTTDELSQWVSRGLFRPSQPTRRGKWRQFDWRDLACLSVMAALRKMGLSVKAAAGIASDLRSAVEYMEEINEPSGLFLFTTDTAETGRLVGPATLASLIRTQSAAIIIVDVAKAYCAASAAIRAKPQCITPPGEGRRLTA